MVAMNLEAEELDFWDELIATGLHVGIASEAFRLSTHDVIRLWLFHRDINP